MMNSDTASADRNFRKNMMASFVQIAALVILVVWCWRILSPFVPIILWGLIIAVSLYPLHQSLATRIGGRQKLAATLFVLLGLAILLVPTFVLTESSLAALRNVGEQLHSGSVTISPPNESVAQWPLVGERVYAFWSDAAANLEGTLNRFQDELRTLGSQVLRLAGATAIGILEFVASIIVAGVFLVSAEGGRRTTIQIASRLVGDRGEALAELSIATIRSVARGVLGVAIIQALLSAVGLVAMGVPAAGIWTFAVLILAIMQLPPIFVLGPVAIWVFSVAAPVPATIFLVYSFIVSISDGFLKPLLLGRGVEIPMFVILLGAIGGMLLAGIVGLFAGAVVLALGYQILQAWMNTVDVHEHGAAVRPRAD